MADDPVAVLPAAPVVAPLLADRAGVVASMATEEIGLASGSLGAGRMHKGDRRPGGGYRGPRQDRRPPRGRSAVGEVHARDEDAARQASRRGLEAIVVRDDPSTPPRLVRLAG